MLANLSTGKTIAVRTRHSAIKEHDKLRSLKDEVLGLIDGPEIPFAVIDQFVKIKSENLEALKMYAANTRPHSQLDTDRFVFGIDRIIDRDVIVECLLRAGIRKDFNQIRVLEFGGGPTFPRYRDAGAPHLSRAIARDPRFYVHMLEDEDCATLPEVEVRLFNLKAHKCGLKEFVEKGPDKFDVIFGRHLYPPQNEEDCQFVLRRMRKLLAKGGVMLFNFDVRLNNHADLGSFIRYKEGYLQSESSLYAHKARCVVKRLYSTPQEFEMNWPTYIPNTNADLVKTVNSQIDSIVLDLLKSNARCKDLSRDDFENQASILLNLSRLIINESTKRLLTANEIRIKCPFQLVQLSRKRLTE